jgi:hypothetical protein
MIKALCAVVLVVILAMAACSQTYYSKSFRLATEVPGQNAENISRLMDGPLEPFGKSPLSLRVVALYSSNSQSKMASNNFNILIEQRFPDKLIDSVLIDSMVVTFLPAGTAHVMHRQSLRLYEGKSMPEPRIRSGFGSLEIPTGIDTARVEFVAKCASSTGGETISKQYSVTVIRWEGSYEKFGVRPTDKD